MDLSQNKKTEPAPSPQTAIDALIALAYDRTVPPDAKEARLLELLDEPPISNEPTSIIRVARLVAAELHARIHGIGKSGRVAVPEAPNFLRAIWRRLGRSTPSPPHHRPAPVYLTPAVLDRANRLVTKGMARLAPKYWPAMMHQVCLHCLFAREFEARAFGFTNLSADMWGLLSFSTAGHEREAALRRLRTISDSAAIPYIILNLADHVPVLWRLAREMFEERLTPEYAPAFARHAVWALPWLERRTVEMLGVQRTKLIQYLRTPHGREALCNELTDPIPSMRLLLYKLLADDPECMTSAPLRALGDRNPIIRAWALRHLAWLDRAQLEPHLPALLRDRSTGVRRAALEAIPHERLAEHRDAIQALLFDRSASTRRRAQALAKTLGGIEIAAPYRQATLSANASPAAVAGLGETGTAEDFPLIERHLAAPQPRMRITALVALWRFDSERAFPHVINALTDEASGVRTATAAIIRRSRNYGFLPDLRRLHAEGSPSMKYEILRAASAYIGWAMLPMILDGLLHGDGLAHEHACGQLGNWTRRMHRLFQSPSPSDRLQILALLDQALASPQPSLTLRRPDFERIRFMLTTN